MSRVQTITVGSDEGDQRLDRWMKRRFPQVSQGMIEKFCRKGEIRVDGGRVKSATRLEEGQQVRIPPLPDGEAPPPPSRTRITDADAKMIRNCVIYRDDHVIALNKPPGLAVQGGSGQSDRHVDALSEALMFDAEEKPRLVHRLDRDTSGVLLMARTRLAAKALTASMRHRETRKIYWAIVAGVPTPYLGEVRYGLVKAGGHGKGGEGEKMIAVHPRDVDSTPGAKRAHTLYATLFRVGSRASWVALEPITGRTHQLRAHMAEVGHPIVGDGKYGGSGQENMGDGWGAQLGGIISKKLHLHARMMRFEHPETRKVITVTAELPEHMAHSWDTFGWTEDLAADDPFETLQ
ncbi:RluA family pseudouridine synthase [Pseudosulfitobacter koreensis]|uniref:Pseudouridine synthase n=1 Tax=Pseudosulfitobacter koreensis TaxID=2968472 RepID=A0ABT1YYQ6_9RHOB|nr:RluA family pseudouridine synthase [Pseudosulfitobacter koreense]MCR8826000.1 RluA family pseudouridine synthase [Pseudosulfitobacter koreense]